MVIAGGLAYVMAGDNEKPTTTFGLTIESAIRIGDERIIALESHYLMEVSATGVLWGSPRISWDGIRDVKIENGLLTGMSFDPMDSSNEWVPFSINLATKEVVGGSYAKYYSDNGPPVEKAKWWKIW